MDAGLYARSDQCQDTATEYGHLDRSNNHHPKAVHDMNDQTDGRITIGYPSKSRYNPSIARLNTFSPLPPVSPPAPLSSDSPFPVPTTGTGGFPRCGVVRHATSIPRKHATSSSIVSRDGCESSDAAVWLVLEEVGGGGDFIVVHRASGFPSGRYTVSSAGEERNPARW
jgi:hypothetical protein